MFASRRVWLAALGLVMLSGCSSLSNHPLLGGHPLFSKFRGTTDCCECPPPCCPPPCCPPPCCDVSGYGEVGGTPIFAAPGATDTYAVPPEPAPAPRTTPQPSGAAKPAPAGPSGH
jgi:hypothetical protein